MGERGSAVNESWVRELEFSIQVVTAAGNLKTLFLT
jgi:hypothetical protein